MRIWKVRETLVGIAARQGFTVRQHHSQEAFESFFALLRPTATEHRLIRAGGSGDGGYLIPDDLEGIDYCFSPGVDRVASFEEDMIARGMLVFQIDASIVDSPLQHERCHFERKYLGIETRGDLITLDDWVQSKTPSATGDLILQMDIEGAEWLTLAQVSDRTLTRFRIMAIEFHDLSRAAEPSQVAVFKPVLERLRHHFDLVHIHANNCGRLLRSKKVELPDVIEITFLRKDRSSVRQPVRSLPHPLDQDCHSGLPAFNIPATIYREPADR